MPALNEDISLFAARINEAAKVALAKAEERIKATIRLEEKEGETSKKVIAKRHDDAAFKHYSEVLQDYAGVVNSLIKVDGNTTMPSLNTYIDDKIKAATTDEEKEKLADFKVIARWKEQKELIDAARSVFVKRDKKGDPIIGTYLDSVDFKGPIKDTLTSEIQITGDNTAIKKYVDAVIAYAQTLPDPGNIADPEQKAFIKLFEQYSRKLNTEIRAKGKGGVPTLYKFAESGIAYGNRSIHPDDPDQVARAFRRRWAENPSSIKDPKERAVFESCDKAFIYDKNNIFYKENPEERPTVDYATGKPYDWAGIFILNKAEMNHYLDVIKHDENILLSLVKNLGGKGENIATDANLARLRTNLGLDKMQAGDQDRYVIFLERSFGDKDQKLKLLHGDLQPDGSVKLREKIDVSNGNLMLDSGFRKMDKAFRDEKYPEQAQDMEQGLKAVQDSYLKYLSEKLFVRANGVVTIPADIVKQGGINGDKDFEVLEGKLKGFRMPDVNQPEYFLWRKQENPPTQEKKEQYENELQNLGWKLKLAMNVVKDQQVADLKQLKGDIAKPEASMVKDA